MWKQNNRDTILAFILLGFVMPLLDVALALWLGMPTPVVHDEFSYLFMADTFAHGRVVNPEHPLSEFFQTFHIIQHNGVYVSKYFPGIGLQLLMGKLLGHPMIGVWLTIALFGVSLLFFLRQFFSPAVALMVSVICDMQFMVLSYFGHSYWGGSLMALGGVWSMGGAVLAVKTGQLRYSWVSAAGMVICLWTRPFEGFFYLLPLAGWQLYSMLRRSGTSGWRWNWRLLGPMMMGVCLGLLALGIYNQRITGSWMKLPYNVYSKYYAPYGVLFAGEHAAGQGSNAFFESLPEPFHQMQDHYMWKRHEHDEFVAVKLSVAGTIVAFLFPWVIAWMFIAAFASQAHWKNGLWRLCVLTVAMRLCPLLLSWSSVWAHYSAVWIFPVAVICAFGLQWLFSKKMFRVFALAASVCSLMWLTSVYLAGFDPRIDLSWKHFTGYQWGTLINRTAVEKYVSTSPQKDVVFVQYGPGHSIDFEWVYNTPVIDAQEVIWAHDLGLKEDQRLINYYPDRDVWRIVVSEVEPDVLEHWQDGKFERAKSFDETESGNQPFHD